MLEGDEDKVSSLSLDNSNEFELTIGAARAGSPEPSPLSDANLN